MKAVRWASVVGLFVIAATAAAAQSGGLKVKVTDTEGQPLPGATVTLESDRGFVAASTDVTNAKGIVSFPVLRPGPGYSIRVEFPGFSPIQESDLRVGLNDETLVPVQMIEEIQERIKVTATRQVVDLEETATTTRFSDDFISDLPVAGRQYQNVLKLAPGVQDPDGDGNPTVHGSRSRDFQTQVGGISNVDPLTGQWLSRINPNSIEEMEVITAGAGVEFGRAQGGFAQIIQKQGSNQHEGVLEFYLKTSKLDRDGAGSRSALPLAEFQTTQPSFNLSGPLIKDKLWYRLSHDLERREDPVNVGSGIEVERVKRGTNSDLITWQASPRNKLALQYQSDPIDSSNLGVSTVRGSDSSWGFKRSGEDLSFTWDAPYSPKVLVKTVAGWRDQVNEFFPTAPGTRNECLSNISQGDAFLGGALCQNLQTGQVTGAYPFDYQDNRQRFTLKSTGTIFGGNFWGMDHTFKIGLSVENERFFQYQRTDPTLFFFVVDSAGDDPNNPGGETSPESYGRLFATLNVPNEDDVRATGTNWAMFLEDQFKPMENMSITLGVRLDREEINSEGRAQMFPALELERVLAQVNAGSNLGLVWPKEFTAYEDRQEFVTGLQETLCGDLPADLIGNCRQQIVNGSSGKAGRLENTRRNENINLANTNFSPSLAFSYSPWDNGKTLFKAAMGRHYNLIPLNIPTAELDPASTTLQYRVDLATGTPLRESSLNPLVDVNTVNRNLRTPYQDEFLLTMERELWAETSLAVSYLRRKYRDQIQDININVATGDYGRCRVQSGRGIAPVVGSPGSGFEVTDPWTQEVYIDNDPGVGDGHLDDCVGDSDSIDLNPESPDPYGNDTYFAQRGDGIDDLYTQNPFWGDIYEIGNYNSSDYEGWVLELTRRQYRNWEMQASYTWSESIGDGEDYNQAIGDDPSLRDNVRGFQSNDQRHVVKLNATTITPWGVRLGTAVSWQSGLPYSVLLAQRSFDTIPPTISDFAPSSGIRPRQQYRDASGFLPRNSARNESYWNVDLKATKELSLSKGFNLQLTATVENVLNDGRFIVYNANAEAGQQLNGIAEGYYEFGRRWEVGMKLAF